jgi:hypothetical protein
MPASLPTAFADAVLIRHCISIFISFIDIAAFD